MTYPRALEIIESYINGNISWAREQIKTKKDLAEVLQAFDDLYPTRPENRRRFLNLMTKQNPARRVMRNQKVKIPKAGYRVVSDREIYSGKPYDLGGIIERSTLGKLVGRIYYKLAVRWDDGTMGEINYFPGDKGVSIYKNPARPVGKNPTQIQRFHQAGRKIADLNDIFMDMVKEGMTRSELKKLIEKRPQIYGRFSHWLSKLPNPQRGPLTQIYSKAETLTARNGRAKMITAQKGPASNDPGQKYYHRFKIKPQVLGLPKGAVLTIPGGRRFVMTRANVLLTGKKDLWKNFRYSRRDFKK